MQQYPYFLYPAVRELKANPSPERLKELRLFIAANVGSEAALTALLGDFDTDLLGLTRGGKGKSDPIDAFIEKFGGGAELPPDSPLMQVVQAQHEESPIEKVKLLVKNGQYAQAIEIMEAFYLNNPKKSIYFADQIRFLKKLEYNARKGASSKTR